MGSRASALSSTSSESVRARQSAERSWCCPSPARQTLQHSADSPKKSPLQSLARGRPSTSTLTSPESTNMRLVALSPCLTTYLPSSTLLCVMSLSTERSFCRGRLWHSRLRDIMRHISSRDIERLQEAAGAGAERRDGGVENDDRSAPPGWQASCGGGGVLAFAAFISGRNAALLDGELSALEHGMVRRHVRRLGTQGDTQQSAGIAPDRLLPKGLGLGAILSGIPRSCILFPSDSWLQQPDVAQLLGIAWKISQPLSILATVFSRDLCFCNALSLLSPLVQLLPSCPPQNPKTPVFLSYLIKIYFEITFWLKIESVLVNHVFRAWLAQLEDQVSGQYQHHIRGVLCRSV